MNGVSVTAMVCINTVKEFLKLVAELNVHGERVLALAPGVLQSRDCAETEGNCFDDAAREVAECRVLVTRKVAKDVLRNLAYREGVTLLYIVCFFNS